MCSTAFPLYMIISSMETNQHRSVHVAPVHGALEEAEALASSYGIRLNSNRPLWQVKVVLYRYSDATGICQYPLLKSKVENNLAYLSSCECRMNWPTLQPLSTHHGQGLHGLISVALSPMMI